MGRAVPSTVARRPRCSSTSSAVCSPTRPTVVSLPSPTSRPSRASPPHTTRSAATGWKYQDVIATLEAKRKAKAEMYWENKQKKKAVKDQAIANVASKTAAIDAQLAELGY